MMKKTKGLLKGLSRLEDNYYAYFSKLQVLQGNSDNDTEVHVFIPPIQARYIRVHPRKWYEHISTRMELLGCLPGISFSSPLFHVFEEN